MPCPTRIIENVFVPMADGVRLAARLWLPVEGGPVPAILEYLPYRKRDGTRSRDDRMHGWFAGAGYAAVRVDIRGSGDSEGHLADEYLPLEQQDACAVIAWIADQPWCDGSVGMMGKSWGGFNALQVAARRPPALKAIITVCSTDDRHADDVHYMGGALLNDNLWWGSVMMTWQCLPPTPSLFGSGWREAWRQRIETLPFLPALWARHQTRDAYWKQGSVCEDPAAIEVPVFAIGGWADGYSNAVPRLLERLPGPCLGLVGPWAHAYPHEGTPGPAIGFLQEALRWWDHWLKGRDTGIMAEPVLRAWMQETVDPSSPANERPGRWVGETSWPSRLITRRPLFLSPGQLWWRPAPAGDLAVRSPLWSGASAGDWMAAGLPGDAPADQRLDDGLSLVFDTKELADRTEILGAPELVLDLAGDSPAGQICVRLCDVAPDGTSTRVSWRILNLTHRRGDGAPVPLVPGEFAIVRIRLDECAHAFPAGHRIRLSVSTAAWPTVWPARDDATLTLRCGESALILPVRRPRREDAYLRFEDPLDPPSSLTAPDRRLSIDLVDGTATLVTDGDAFGAAAIRYDEIETGYGHRIRRAFSIRDRDPTSASQRVVQTCHLSCEGRTFRVEATSAMTGTREAFSLTAEIEAFEDDRLFARRVFDETIPRDMV